MCIRDRLTTAGALSDDDIVDNILTRDKEQNEEEEEMEQDMLPCTLEEALCALRLVSTYFRCHDIETSLKQQVINIYKMRSNVIIKKQDTNNTKLF